MPAKINVLVVEDASDLREELVDYLRFSGFEAQGAASLAQMGQALAGAPWQVLVLDLGLPDGDGLLAARELRARQGLALGLVMMTARGHDEDRIAGRTAGADAYLVKPVNPRELKAVIDQLALRLAVPAAAPAPAQPRDEWRLDLATLRLFAPGGAGVVLTGAEARLLALLIDAHGEVRGREPLCLALGHSSHLDDTRRLDSLVSRLRSKVEQQAGIALPVQTYRNLGYAFTGAVQPERRAAQRVGAPA